MRIGRANRIMKITSKFAGIMLFICALFRHYRVSSYIALIVFILYIVNSIVLEKDRLFIKYLPVTLSALFFLVGTFVCDNMRLWLGEINETTYYVGAFNLLAVYYWILFSSLGFFEKRFYVLTSRKNAVLKVGSNSITGMMYKYGPLIVFLTSSILFLMVARNPSFSGNYVNRFEYAQENINRFVNILRVFPPIFCPLLIEPFINRKKKISFQNILRYIVVPYCPYILFLVWTGNKYGAFIELVYLFVIPIISFVAINKNVIKNILKYIPMVMISLILLLLLYYYLAGNDFSTTLEKIGIRVACQGELWWKMIAQNEYHGFDIVRVNNELSAIYKSIIYEAENQNYGVYRLMELLGAPAVVKLYMSQGTRFTSAGIELPFYCMGYISFLIIPLVYGVLMAYFINVYVNATKERRFVAAIGSARLILVTLSAITQGDWYVYFSVIPFALLCGVIISQKISKKR